MNDPGRKEIPEQTETGRSEKIQVADDELEKVAGGANFRFFDNERKKPKDKEKPVIPPNSD